MKLRFNIYFCIVKSLCFAIDSGRTLAVHLYQLQQEGLHLEKLAVAVYAVVVVIMNAVSSKAAKTFK